MAEEQKETTKDWEKEVVEIAGNVAQKVARLSLHAMTFPISLLPGKSREHATRAFGEFAMAFMTASREIADSVEKFADRVAAARAEGERACGKKDPSTQSDVRDKASSFSERVAGTAEEVKPS